LPRWYFSAVRTDQAASAFDTHTTLVGASRQDDRQFLEKMVNMMMSRRFTLLVAPRGNSGLATHGLSCPCCKSSVFRVARRLPDLLLSLFTPIQRYRCISMKCSWEGNFRQKRSALLQQNMPLTGE
jgi:hypothetical protein